MKKWYFVRRLRAPDEESNAPTLEIQLLDQMGRAADFQALRESDKDATLAGEPVPEPVIQAAQKMAPGSGSYVDATGQETPAF